MTGWLDAVAELGRRARIAHVDWLLVGSAASAMHGVEVEPADVDVLVRRPSDVALIAGHLYDVAEQATSERNPKTFVSSIREPLLWFRKRDHSWTLGRWHLDGVLVEVAHISGPPADLVETWGDRVWNVRHDVTLDGVTAPCVPLEVQVATALVRNDVGRRRALTTTLGQGTVDVRLLTEALLGRGFRPESIADHPDVLELLPARMRPRRGA